MPRGCSFRRVNGATSAILVVVARRELPLLPGLRRPATWLELALDYRCNLRCLGCHACDAAGESMSSTAAVRALREGRRRGCSRLWLGGGEPTLRADLLALVRAARAMGYVEVLLQTNGVRLSYPAYRDAVLAAGVTEVRFNVKSSRAELHDRLSQGECHRFLLAALGGLVGAPVIVSADVLLARSSLPDLPDVVSFYGGRGVTRMVLWLLSASDGEDPEVTREIPSFTEVIPWLTLADGQARRSAVELHSLHTPLCVLPPALRHLFWPASSLGLIVTGPDGGSFALETSPFESGPFLDGCGACAERPRCGGPRADYVRIHGGAELVPVARAEGSRE